jgi:hypothetical protein
VLSLGFDHEGQQEHFGPHDRLQRAFRKGFRPGDRFDATLTGSPPLSSGSIPPSVPHAARSGASETPRVKSGRRTCLRFVRFAFVFRFVISPSLVV